MKKPLPQYGNLCEDDEPYEAAFAELYKHHREKLINYATKHTENRDLSNDLVQEVFTTSWEKRNALSKVDDVSAYLMTILKHKIVDHFREKRNQNAEQTSSVSTVNMINVEQQHMRLEHIFNEELEKLPHNMRHCFQLRLDQKSNEDIAKSLRLSRQTVNNLLSEASKRLKSRLTHRFDKDPFIK